MKKKRRVEVTAFRRRTTIILRTTLQDTSIEQSTDPDDVSQADPMDWLGAKHVEAQPKSTDLAPTKRRIKWFRKRSR